MKTTINILSKLLLFICILIFIASCDNDDNFNSIDNEVINNQDYDTFSQNFGNNVNRDFMGTIIDTNESPLAGVTVSIGSSTTTTDSNGVFIINNATVYNQFAYIKASKSGYINGSRSLVPSEGTNRVTIMLFETAIVGTTQSGSTDVITMSNGASVTLKGDFIKEDGTAYEGNVNVVMQFLNPTDDDMPSQMPGMLYASNYENEERMLQTFGMLAIELYGDGGETLNIAEDSDAEITIPLDSETLVNAPTTIPLWYFDEEHGYWKEDGEATLNGNAYVGSVKHFTFWNCDLPIEMVNFCITFVDDDNNPLSDITVRIESENYGSRTQTSNNLGMVCGNIPKNEPIVIHITSNFECPDNPYFWTEVLTLNTDDNWTLNLPFNNTGLSTTTIQGNFNDCDGNPVTNGYVEIRYDGRSYYDLVTNGTYNVNLAYCNNNTAFTIKGYDLDNLQSTDIINYTFTNATTSIGVLNSCNTSSEFIQYTIDDNTADTITIFSDIDSELYTGYFGEPILYISGYESGIEECFSITGYLNPSPYIGTYGYANTGNNNPSIGFDIEECFDIDDSGLPNITFNLNSIGNIGEYIDMSFSGTYPDSSGNLHSISGIIHVLRDN